MKKCTKCKKSFPDDAFHHNRSVPSGRNAACKVCCAARQKAIYDEGRALAAVQAEDEVDYLRILVYLRSARLPSANLSKIGIIDAWNDVTELHLPRMSDRGKDLKTMELTQ